MSTISRNDLDSPEDTSADSAEATQHRDARSLPTALRSIIATALSILVAEFSVMLAIPYLPPLSALAEALLDALALTLLLIPMLYFFLYRPIEGETTKRRLAGEALHESEEKYRTLADNVTDIIWTTDSDFNIDYLSPSIEGILGFSPEERIGERISVMNAPEYTKQVEDGLNFFESVNEKSGVQALVELDLPYMEIDNLHKDGSIVPVEVQINILADEKGQLKGLLGVTRDITERRQAERELRDSQQRMELALHGARLGTWDTALPSGVKTYDNRYAEMLGYTLDELAAMERFEEELHPDDELRVSEAWGAHASGKMDAYEVEYRIRHKSGHWVWVLCNGRIVEYDDDGTPRHASGTHLDISERKQAEQALRESQQRMELALKGADLGTWEFAFPSGELTYDTGYTEILGYTIDEQFELEGRKHPDDVVHSTKAWEELIDGQVDLYETEYRLRHKLGHWVWLLSRGRITEYDKDGNPLRASGTHLDITERKTLETQLQQALKMEAIGTLAGGIAHDFNNMLGIILGNAEMAALDVPDLNPARGNIDQIRETTLRARDVVKQILAFSRKDEQELRPIEIGRVISESLKLIRSTIPTTIEIRESIPQSINTVMGDPAQISQILLNLCTNAAHAMGDEGGVLSVVLEQLHLDEERVGNLPGLAPGNHVRLSIGDTGRGISSDDIGRIFDPYFTTKGVGEGTGMGLAVVHGIVQQLNGAITVDSQIGKGTVLDVFIPTIEGEAEADLAGTDNIPRGNEHILFVDDEPAMSRIYASMLQRLGYTVSFRTSSIEALEAFKAQPDKYDVVITDQTMPHLTGKMLAAEVMTIRPDVPIILCTGHSDLIDEKRAEAMGIRAFVTKPIAMGEIAKILREVLDRNDVSI